ncbi:MAG: hypothetical protein IKA96_07155 [Alistipes sp.]|nr:hypothetical protein [Alistipes sp.]
MVGKNTYVRDGYTYRDCTFVDGVDVRDGKLIAIQTNVEVQEPVSQEILGDNFKFSDGYYEQVGSIKTLMDKAELRNYLYQNGFKCDGVEYVRYKRSSGSSRVGKCLFVNKLLADEMSVWDKCGLNIEEGQQLDLASWEAYIALPISSIIDTIHIPLESILVIDDYESTFQEEVVSVEIENNHLVSARKKVDVTNSIWDGQSIMDKSLFGEYEDKGMLLLRNRFFKSCCFNANIQQWFADNGVTSVEQLNGFTLATDISQIKLITTPSSIKYAKFGTIEDWMKNVEPVFGVVKYEKKPRQFGGRLVQAHYQLFNTLQLSYEEMEQVLKPSLDYIGAIRRDPAVLRYAIQYPFDDGTGWYSSLDSKNEIVFRMLGINDKFAQTKMYYDFRDDLVKGEIRNLKKGHVLVNGNYSTLMGNGMEMLQASIGQFHGESIVGVGNIHSKRFAYGQTLLASRSPHVTIGNILLTKNVACELYDTYFNMTDGIVCVNAINENIQQRLNGCDYDSDTMLITDDALLIEVARRHYDEFLVPTNMTSSVKTARYYTQDDKADLDVKTSVNKIGEIINLSQQLNSLMWDRISKGASVESCMELYYDICKLAVLSNIEIDRAKREFTINSTTEINILKRKYKITDDEKTVKPQFFKMITTENGFELSDNVRYKYFNTSMDYLQKIISRFNFREGRECKRSVVPFMSIVKEPSGNYSRQGYYYKQRDKIISVIRAAKEEKHKLFTGYDTMSQSEKESVWRYAGEIKQDCIEEVERLSSCPATMYLVLKDLDSPDCRDVAKFVFEVLFGRPDEAFFTMIPNSKEEVYTLIEDDDGELEFYGFHFSKVLLSETANTPQEQ